MKKRRKSLAVAPRPVPASRNLKQREWLLALGLAGVTFLVYLPALSCDFVAYDDAEYVTENRVVWQGLSPAGVRWALTAVVSANWHPLTMLSLMLDSQLYGLKPFGFHLTNLLLHVANTVLLFHVLRVMTDCVGRSAAVALLFALHPLHVESVAWVAERKDGLSTLFGLLALWAYLWYTAAPSWRRLAVVTTLLALSLLAKPMWVTFPFLLLLLDWWPLRRTAAGWGASGWEGEAPAEPRVPARQEPRPPNLRLSWRRLVVEKTPLFLLVAVFCAVTLATQASGGPGQAFRAIPLPLRLGNAAVSCVEYLRQTLAPLDLAAFYPHPRASLNVVLAVCAAVAVVLVSAAAIWGRERVPYLLVGWFWYLGMLMPVIGLVQVGDQARADRYTYVPLVGIFVVLAWGAADLFRRARLPGFAAGLAGVAGLFCALYTWAQVSHWADAVTLWQQVCRVSPNNAFAHKNLGAALMTRGQFDVALAEFDCGLELDPNDAELHANRGQALFGLKRLAEAEQSSCRALDLDPRLAQAHQQLGLLRFRDGRLDEAADSFAAARDAKPSLAAAWLGLGKVRFKQKKLAEAEEDLNEALRLDPRVVETYDTLACVLAEAKRFPEAIAVIDRGLAHAEPGRNDELVAGMRQRRALFTAGQSYR
jgi:tetratricopeptide (TPR) repeat protein